MYEVHLKYSFNTFGSKPKRGIEKIEDCKILFYGVSNDDVELIIRCPSEDILEKLKHYLAIAYELFPKKVVAK
jgi:hypothetical protein